MSIFDRLKNAIFGSGSKTTQAAAPSQASPSAAQAARPSSAAAAPGAAMHGPTAAPGSAPAPQVDIEATLTALAARKQEKLNWRSSIVDLMKLVDLDPSLENRKTLAGELGYTGDTHDSASMNIWLHKQVMAKLAAAGGKVPDSLRH